MSAERRASRFNRDLARLDSELFRTSGRSSAAGPGRSEALR